jgi:hypothetical protein
MEATGQASDTLSCCPVRGDTATPRMREPAEAGSLAALVSRPKLVSKIVVSTDPGRVEDPINLLLRERFFFLFLDLS